MKKGTDQAPFSAKSRKKPPKKPKNKDYRSREYLTDNEIEQLRKAAKNIGRHSIRDDALILIMFRHGLRVGEVTTLRWDQVDFKKGFLHVKRLKNGLPSTHPIRGTELRLLRQLLRCNSESPYVFTSERKAPLTDRAIRHIIARAGVKAGFPFPIHPHMLRHSTGFYLANNGNDTRAIQSYLGHTNINHTVKYTELSSSRFKDFFRD